VARAGQHWGLARGAAKGSVWQRPGLTGRGPREAEPGQAVADSVKGQSGAG
jgi:hypothetical protein